MSFRIQPLGSVAYDGQVLPLISPDGKFAAVQQGDPPNWPTLLAQPGASPAVSTSIAVYGLASNTLDPVVLATPLQSGVVLGRSCDDRGFLVELPKPDGTRWIGRAAWLTGSVTWLVRSDHVNAHAVILPTGELAFTRRAVSSSTSALVLRSPDGSERVREGELSYMFPVFGGDSTLSVVAASSVGLELITIRVRRVEAGRAADFGPILARLQVAAGTDPALAYQIVAPAQATLLGRVGADAVAESRPVCVFHPGMNRMAEFDWRRGIFVPLAPQSIAAVASPFVEPGGYFSTTPQGLMFAPFPREDGDPGAKRTPLGRVLDIPYVARATRDPARALVLFGPVARSNPPRIEVITVNFPPPEAEPSAPKVQ